MEMGRMVMEYSLNAVWLAPLIAGAAWLLVKVARLRPAGEHRVWLGAMIVCMILPGAGVWAPRVQASVAVAELQPMRVSTDPLDSGGTVLPERLAAPVSLSAETVEQGVPSAAGLSRRELFFRRPREIPLGPKAVEWFEWGYAGVLGFAVLRMARTWWVAVRLVRDANPYAMSAVEDAALERLAERFRVNVPPVLCSERVQSPVVVGIWRAILLLPVGFGRCSKDERRAALCHELAHVRRKDCMVHAGVQLLMLPLVWHPAMHGVGRRIARTREMACDEMAAQAMNCEAGELTYARCLLNMAHTMVRGDGEGLSDVGLGLFRTNKLEERVMRLTEVNQIFRMREILLRRAAGVAVAAIVLAAGALMHVAPVVAQESTRAASAAPAAPGLPHVASAPVAAVVPVASGVASPAPAPQPALAPQSAPAPEQPAPQAAPGQTPPAPPAPEASGSGASVGLGPSGTATGTDVFVDRHFAVARGQNAHVQVPKGRYLHRWVGADGEPYESADDHPGDLSAEQKRAAEAEFARRMAQLDAQVAYWKSPAYRQRLREQAGVDAALAGAKAELAAASAKFNSPKFKLQMQKLNSPEFRARIDTQLKSLQVQMAQLDSEAIQEQVAQLKSPEFAAKITEAERQAALANTPEMQQKLRDAARQMNEASARLEAATKALAEAQRRLQEQTAK